ncbi:MAG: hypothetical protein WC444_02770 [Candidatus Paceibacterota bacterium]
MASRRASKTPKQKKSPQSETATQKEKLLVQLTKVPIVQIATERVGIGRSTYYAWRDTDEEFRELADKALREGNCVINDLAESRLIKNIQEGNNTSIIFWLKNHSSNYSDRIVHQMELPKFTAEDAKELGQTFLRAFGGSLAKVPQHIVDEFQDKNWELDEDELETLNEHMKQDVIVPLTEEDMEMTDEENEVVDLPPPKSSPNTKRRGVNLQEFEKRRKK